MKTIYIGIDPDLVKSGLAVVIKGEVIDLQSLSIVELITFINRSLNDISNEYIFAVENVEAKRATFARRGMNPAQMQKIAQNVGQVKAVARLIVEIITAYTGKPPIMVPAGINRATKKDAKQFNVVTGWNGRSNEDTRDAAIIALHAYKNAV